MLLSMVTSKVFVRPLDTKIASTPKLTAQISDIMEKIFMELG